MRGWDEGGHGRTTPLTKTRPILLWGEEGKGHGHPFPSPDWKEQSSLHKQRRAMVMATFATPDLEQKGGGLGKDDALTWNIEGLLWLPLTLLGGDG